MRAMLLVPIGLPLTAAVGYAICRASGFDPHAREMLVSAAIAVLASIAGLVPLVLTRGASQPAVAQAGLVATAAHLLVGIGAGGAVLLILKPANAFVYWLLAFYWATLVGVVAAAVQALKSAAAAPVGPRQ